ncbi:MAG TPA: serine hydrolase domain-containing protein [Ilumatobacteraceae bacterium]|nr:serine hydrolase domain-containing protein [Ilumatobacteraceae bacterium]
MIRDLVAAAAAEELCPTIAWGVVQHGRLTDGEHTDLVFRIASMTKSFTVAAILSLRDEGVWRLDDPVAKYAPELAAVRGPAGSPPITLHHLMSMSSGLATDDAWADRHLDISADDIDLIYAAGPTFACRPGEAFEYSNLGFGMLGRAVFRATGRRVQDVVSERFLRPLGMDDTTWVQPAHDRWARPHRVEDGRSVPDPDPLLGDGEIAPMGGLWTTVADLAKWVTWLDGPEGPAYRRDMQRIHTYQGVVELAGHRSPMGYGYGLNVRDDEVLGPVVAHSGGLPGYGSNMRWVRGRGVGAIALANTTYASMSVLTLKMLHALHAEGAVPPPAPLVSPLLTGAADALVALLNDWDDRRAEELFADNVALDESLARRAAAAATVIARHGSLIIDRIEPSQVTSGTVHLRGSVTEASLQLELQLSPEPSAPVQWYELRG